MDDHGVTLRFGGDDLTAPQHRVLVAHLHQALELRVQGHVRLTALVDPGVGAAVHWVVAASHTDFIAAINGRCARVAHLKENGQQQALFGLRDRRGRVFCFAVTQLVQGARCIVGGQQIHQGVEGMRRVGLTHGFEVSHHVLRLAAGRIRQHRIAEDAVDR